MSKPISNDLAASSTAESTPLMKQYWELKAQAGGALLLFRMGDFYELFGEDAVTAANLLEITLTTRDKNKPNPIPMAGVPHHSIQNYIQRLLKAGKKVAIGEQMEDPETVKAGKIVRREIIRILTPGVQFDSEGSEANYLATILRVKQESWILACLDASTGETLVSDPIDLESVSSEITRLPIRHLLNLEPELDLTRLPLNESVLIENLPKNYLSLERAVDTLNRHFEVENLDAFIRSETGTLAVGILVVYALRTQQQERLAHLRLPEPLQKPKTLILGPNTAQHLDLNELFSLINQTKSTLGARQLKRWLLAPLRSAHEILIRQNAVQELQTRWTSLSLGEKLSSQLAQVYDLERITARINTQLANPKDTLALGQSLQSLNHLKSLLSECSSPLLIEIRQKLIQLSETLTPLSERIVRTQREDAPTVSREGGIFRTSTTPELDRLLSLTEDGQKWLVELETREREKTGIPSLKVRYNRVFGYYIEITSSHLKNVPAHYQRKQTMVGAERFFTEELKKFEEEILTASVKQKALEQELFNQLISEIQQLTQPIMQAAQLLGELDSLLALTRLTQQPGWCFPEIDDSLHLEIHAGRHPMVDQVKRGSFVPNDVLLSPHTRLTLLITGPNMGGKSTVMRQTALIVLLGQMGAPVPATKARWGVVSSLYTRIGAQDAISRGQSTFMVEMSELAHILHHADDRSLIILDEIGRGTSTYDGISVAWATLEWICNRIRARTLFATHYHELIRLAFTLPLLANAHMAVDDENQEESQQKSLRFLYELKEGPTHESFGIHVAQIAGLPKPVIKRAWKILGDLESETGGKGARTERNQLSLFAAKSEQDSDQAPLVSSETSARPTPPQAAPVEPHPVLKELELTDINEMTPLQALNFVAKLKKSVAQTLHSPVPSNSR
jgi:DNA mismatch repair protein MutS